ncbi:MAG: biotin/lipoyl-binding protein [bacterium]|nr:biotin/lipoyl-binding protein [bacterium]
MKIYKVKVNGKVYEVELESVSETNGTIVSEKKNDAPASAAPAASGEGTPLLSPIQGTVLKINVSEGSAVKKGDVLLVIEAMKLENDIVAPKDGVVKGIKVSKGQTVSSKEQLLIIG